MALGAQVGMLSPTPTRLRGHQLGRFHQKVSKTVKRGVPPVFDPFSGRLRLNGYPPPSYGPLEGLFAPQVGSLGREKGTSGRFLEVGGGGTH